MVSVVRVCWAAEASALVLVQTQLQTLGQASWIVQLVNSTIATPNSINATTKNFCRDQFGHWCLGKHPWML